MTYEAEKLVPYHSHDNKGTQVERMFDAIAEDYDALNRTMSVGIDIGWRKKGINELQSIRPKTILDIATGTGDLALMAYQMLKPDSILGIDLSEGMMNVAREKIEKANLGTKIAFEKQDCLNLDLNTNSFDAAMVAFGVRNFENLDKGLSEICRVLKPGGKLMILELSTPENFPIKQLHWLYTRLYIPVIGRIMSKDGAAYSYLPKSIEAFIQGKEMVNTLLKNGFAKAEYKTYTFGVCTMYLAIK